MRDIYTYIHAYIYITSGRLYSMLGICNTLQMLCLGFCMSLTFIFISCRYNQRNHLKICKDMFLYVTDDEGNYFPCNLFVTFNVVDILAVHVCSRFSVLRCPMYVEALRWADPHQWSPGKCQNNSLPQN
jgi:hypothetical protein